MEIPVRLTAVFEEAEEGGYIAYFEELPGVNTQGETLDEAKVNLAEAYQLVIETQKSIDVTERKKSLQQAANVSCQTNSSR